jgi:hypothetical protein
MDDQNDVVTTSDQTIIVINFQDIKALLHWQCCHHYVSKVVTECNYLQLNMANRNDGIVTRRARLPSTSTSTTRRQNLNHCSLRMEGDDENDVMMQDDESDNNSIPTTMGVRASCMAFSNRNRSASHRRDRNESSTSNDNASFAGNISSLFIPLPMPSSGQPSASVSSTDQRQQQQHQMNVDNGDCDDEISILTEYSMEENEDDNLSQTTANTTWTCVTEVTGSTTAAAPNSRTLTRRRILANKRIRVQPSQETGNPDLFRDSLNNPGSDQLKRRRTT